MNFFSLYIVTLQINQKAVNGDTPTVFFYRALHEKKLRVSLQIIWVTEKLITKPYFFACSSEKKTLSLRTSFFSENN